jgi:hypothetical protein
MQTKTNWTNIEEKENLYIEQDSVDEIEKLIESAKFKEKSDWTMEDEGRINI